MANKLNESIEKIVREAQEKGISVTADELMKIVKTHSAGTAASAMISGAFPGVGTAVTMGIEIGFVWSMYGIKCVGVPIFNKAGQVCAAISISGPSLRFGQKRINELAQMLREYAHKIELGIY